MPFTIIDQPVALILKQQTEESHLALEALVLPRLQAIAAPADYARLLHSFYGYFKPVEEAVAPYMTEDVLPDWPRRRKADLILNDLAALSQPVDSLPLAPEIPVPRNLPQALGALYVLEGSTLGGRSITKMLLKNSLAQLDKSQLQFFDGYGDATGPMWKAFVNALNSFYFNAAEVEALVASANRTFDLFKRWLQQNP